MKPTTELYFEFLQFVLRIFTDLNIKNGGRKPKLYSDWLGWNEFIM